VSPSRPDLVAQAITPDYALGPHTASLGITYAARTSLPERFSNGMVVTQHGSWNRVPRSGYRVLFVPFTDGKPSGQPIVLLTGFLDRDENAQGRPAGVAIDTRGGILIADDAGNTIWRVTGTQPRQVAAAQPTLTERFKSAVDAAEAAVAQSGTTPRRCVDALSADNPQSGDFLAGGFSVYSATWHQGQGRLAFKPLRETHGAMDIRVTSLDSKEVLDFLHLDPTSNGNYTAAIRLPHPGTWMIEAKAGSAWGCFLYSLR
jgi:hypothetical protein